jgi:hypothetical protein
MRDARTASRRGSAPIAGAAGFPGAVRYFVGRGGRVPGWGHVQRYQLGVSRIPVSESQRRGAMNAIVREAGTYPEIRRSLAGTMRATGLNEQQLARAMRTIAQGGGVPRPLHRHAQTMGGVAMLMFGREAARNPAMVAMAPMTVSLIARGEMTWNQALSDSRSALGGGAFPMSMEQAQAAARGLAAEAQGIPPRDVDGGSTAARRELLRREIAMAERWLEVEMRAAGLTAFKHRQDAVNWIRRKILDFYGMP